VASLGRVVKRGFAVAGLVAAASAFIAQSGPNKLGVTESEARGAMMSALEGSNGPSAGTKAFLALPPTARAAIVTDVVAWAKIYVNSAAFKTAWTNTRNQSKPQAPDAISVDDELKKADAEQQKQIDEVMRVAGSLPADQRKQMEDMVRQQLAAQKTPEMIAMRRQMLEAERAGKQQQYQDDLKKWQSDYPVDVNVVVAKRLHDFLEMSGDVNFGAPVVTRNGQKVFADPQYEAKPAAWKMCYRAGREAVTSARAAAQAWLKELGK